MKNKEIADLFERFGILLEIKGENIFKVKAYSRAAENILALTEDIETIQKEGRLAEIPGIGKALQEKIEEYLKTGKMHAYQDLIKEVPESLIEIVNIPSIGPKKAKLFYDELKITAPKQLLKAAQEGKLLGLPSIKEKTIENILRGIKIVEESKQRIHLGTAHTIAGYFVGELSKLKDVKKLEVSGSLRRGRETIGDIDILIEAANPKPVMDAFISLPQVKSVLANGETKSSILTQDNVQVDIRVVDASSFGAALLYFTGSKNFNIKLRQIAIDKNMKVNEYGIFKVKGEKEELVASKTEKDCFKALGLNYIPPELREDIGEAELFSKPGGKIPDLIELKDIRGEFHVHSTYSDGKNTIEEMANKAQSLGYEYLAISDHSAGLRIAGGVLAKDLPKKKEEIEDVNKRLKNFSILFGTELEIDSDGNLDYNEKILSEFDVVIAAIHSGFEQGSKKLTQRLIKACQSKYVNIIAHPTGVHLGKREPYEFDFKEVCKAANDHNVFLEINAFPIRLDLNSQNVYFARSQGCKFVINTDAHRIEHMDYMPYGVSIARRGWLEKKNVLNTLKLTEVLKVFKK